MIMNFDNESPAELTAEIEHVNDELIPALTQASGLQGWWFVDRDAGRRVTVMVWDTEEQYQAAMALVTEERAKTPDTHRPSPTSAARFEVYASIPGSF